MDLQTKNQVLFIKGVRETYLLKTTQFDIDKLLSKILKLKNNLIRELKKNLTNSLITFESAENYLILLENELRVLPFTDKPGRGLILPESVSEVEEDEYFKKAGAITYSAIVEISALKESFLSQKNKGLVLKSSEFSDIENEIDLSKTKATEKIIYLKELGVLDYLRKIPPFNTSINSLATILSAITGEQTTTLQPCLNAMYGKGIDTNKNPYTSKKTVKKVQSQLMHIGFQLN